MLRLVRDAERRGAPVMSVGAAVRRLTAEIADCGLDAGTIAKGRRADVVLLDPEALDDRVDAVEEAPIDAYGGFVRLVRRNDDAVRGVWVDGRRAVAAGAPLAAVGRERGFGTVLRGPR